MTAPLTRSLAWLAGAALLVAACGGSTPTGAPTPAPTAAPTQAPAASDANPTFPMPSIHGDEALEALFPDEIAGQAVSTLSMTGTAFLASGMAGEELEPILTKLNKTPADLSVAFGTTPAVAIFAFRVKGVPAAQFLEAYSSAIAEGSTLTDGMFGGKQIKKVNIAGEDSLFIYPKDDIVWTVTGSGLTDPLLDEAFSKLP